MSFAANAESVALPRTPPESSGDAENAKAIELKDRFVADLLVSLREEGMLEREDLGQLKACRTTDSVTGGFGKSDLVHVGNAPQCEDSNLSERGIHSLTHSVTDELSRPVSEVDDGSHVDDSAEVSSRNSIPVSPPTAEKKRDWDLFQEDHDVVRGSEFEGDDFEGADGEIDSVSGGQSHEALLEEPEKHILFPDGKLREGDGKEEELEEDGEIIRAYPELQDELRTTESKLNAPAGHRYPPQSVSEEFRRNQNNLDANETDSSALNLGILSTETPQDEDEASTRQSRLDAESCLLYPQQLDPEDVINPFSLEVRIRKAREQQDISLEWEAETIAENIVGISQPQFDLEETNRSNPPDLEEITADQRTCSSDTAIQNGFYSEIKRRVGTEPRPPEHLLEENAKESSTNKTGIGEAVLLGALASGVNKPTLFVIRAVLVGLLASLLLLLHVALKSGSWFVLLNVLFLIAIAGGLILLLNWYISETGLVSVDKQMVELNLIRDPGKVESKTL